MRVPHYSLKGVVAMKQLILALIAAFALSACGGGGGAGTSSTPAGLTPPVQNNFAGNANTTTLAQTVYVLQFWNDTPFPQVLEYPANSSGSQSPSATLSDARGNFPQGAIAVDANGDLFIAYNQGAVNPAQVAEYALGSTGAVTPSRVIDASGIIKDVFGMAVGQDGSIYVLAATIDCGAPNELVVYAPGASGKASPARVITGSNTRFNTDIANSFAVDAQGNVYIAYAGTTTGVFVFGPTANGNVAPDRNISGSLTQMSLPSLANIVVITPGNQIAVLSTLQKVTEYPLNANGNVPPSNSFTVQAANNMFFDHMAVDAQGNFWLSAGAGGVPLQIVEYAANASGTPAPIRMFTSTASRTVFGLAVR